MSRKTNNLKKRMRVQNEQMAKRMADAIDRERAAIAAERDLKRHAALIITTPEPRPMNPREHAMYVHFVPDMFLCGFARSATNRPCAVEDYAMSIGYDTGRKIGMAIAEYIGSTGMASAWNPSRKIG